MGQICSLDESSDSAVLPRHVPEGDLLSPSEQATRPASCEVLEPLGPLGSGEGAQWHSGVGYQRAWTTVPSCSVVALPLLQSIQAGRSGQFSIACFQWLATPAEDS